MRRWRRSCNGRVPSLRRRGTASRRAPTTVRRSAGSQAAPRRAGDRRARAIPEGKIDPPLLKELYENLNGKQPPPGYVPLPKRLIGDFVTVTGEQAPAPKPPRPAAPMSPRTIP